jgi:cellulose biosynthesis protein BcsQ
MSTKRRRSVVIASGGGSGVSSPRVNVNSRLHSARTSIPNSSVSSSTTKTKRARVVEPSRTKPRPAVVASSRPVVVAHKLPLITAVYGTKGGVGKSTSVALLVAAAIRAKQQVLVIDMDAQCSITRILAPTYSVGDTSTATKRSESVPVWPWPSPLYNNLYPGVTLTMSSSCTTSNTTSTSFSTSSPSSSTSYSLSSRPLSAPTSSLTSPSSSALSPQPQPQPPPTCSPLSRHLPPHVRQSTSRRSTLSSVTSIAVTASIRQTKIATISDLLDQEIVNRRTDSYQPMRVSEYASCVPGDPRLTRFHTEVLVDGDDMLRPVRRSAFRRIALAAAAACGAAIVLVDMSPSTGILNKVVLMSCDACIPCTFCDEVSLSPRACFSLTRSPNG